MTGSMADAPSPDLMIRQLQARLDQVEHDNRALRSKYAKLKSAMTADKQKLENDLQLLKKKTISTKAELKGTITGLKEHIMGMECMIVDLKDKVNSCRVRMVLSSDLIPLLSAGSFIYSSVQPWHEVEAVFHLLIKT